MNGLQQWQNLPAVCSSQDNLIVYRFKASLKPSVTLPFFLNPVRCGFPSPADDYVDSHIDLNEHLIRHPSATFFVRASGNSMINAGICSGDLLIIDRAPKPADNSIVLAVVDGDFTIKRLRRTSNGKIYLIPENPAFKTLEVTSEMQFEVWGTVTHVIHQV